MRKNLIFLLAALMLAALLALSNRGDAPVRHGVRCDCGAILDLNGREKPVPH